MSAIWLTLRFVGVAVGVITLLGYATNYLHIDFKPLFAEFLRQLEDLVLNVPLQWVEEWLVRPVVEWMMHNFGYPLAYPAEHWRPVFTLTWLWFLSISRSGGRFFTLGSSAFVVVWALFCALASAILAGEGTLAGANAPPLMGFVLFYLGISTVTLKFRIMLLCFVITTFVAAVGYYAPTTMGFHLRLTASEYEATRGLVSLAAGVGALGLLCLALGVPMGYFEGKGLSHALKDDVIGPFIATGLDVVGTMGLALGIGYLMMR